MKCDVCKEAEATVHLTQIVSGAMQKIDLCEDCAKTKGVSDPTGFSLADMLLGLGHEAIAAVSAPTGAEARCAVCGMTQSDFRKSGRLGCAQCYETFGEMLAPLLKSMHKGEQHVGKSPANPIDNAEVAEQLKSLRHELDQAIKEENFEAAAEIRDRIRRLEQEGRTRARGKER